MKKIVSMFIASVLFASFLSVTGCTSTWEGIGKDIEKMGKDMQDSGKE